MVENPLIERWRILETSRRLNELRAQGKIEPLPEDIIGEAPAIGPLDKCIPSLPQPLKR